jgi:hypothetical protein
MGGDSNYRALPIRLHKGSQLVRHLFIKPHVGQDSLPKDRALFVTGLPYQLDEGSLLELFSKFGRVERAAVHASKVSAVVLYSAASGRDGALQAAAKGLVQQIELAEPSEPFGLKGGRLLPHDLPRRPGTGTQSTLCCLMGTFLASMCQIGPFSKTAHRSGLHSCDTCTHAAGPLASDLPCSLGGAA